MPKHKFTPSSVLEMVLTLVVLAGLGFVISLTLNLVLSEIGNKIVPIFDVPVLWKISQGLAVIGVVFVIMMVSAEVKSDSQSPTWKECTLEALRMGLFTLPGVLPITIYFLFFS